MSASGARAGGVLLEVGTGKRFVPVDVAVRIVRAPRITRIAGAPPELLGIVLLDGQAVPVVAFGDTMSDASGDGRDELVLCTFMGEPIALAGARVLASGMVDTEGARPVDLAAVYARIQAGGWATRWGG